MKATQKTTLVIVEWPNGNTDVFSSYDDLEETYPMGDESHEDAMNLAKDVEVAVGGEYIDHDGEVDMRSGYEWSEKALELVGAA